MFKIKGYKLFNADQPIRTSEEDILGRKFFAYNLAETITSYDDKNNIVIGTPVNNTIDIVRVKNIAVYHVIVRKFHIDTGFVVVRYIIILYVIVV